MNQRIAHIALVVDDHDKAIDSCLREGVQQARRFISSLTALLLLCASVGIIPVRASAQTAPYINWAINMGGIDQEKVSSITVDDAGNLYATGTFEGTADFDPSAATADLTSAAGTDIFIAKYDASGNYVYVKRIGGVNNDMGNSIAVDDYGNVIVTGIFWGTVDFDPSEDTVNLTSVGLTDIFLAKYDAAGNYVYAKGIGGMASGIGYSVAVDGFGNVILAGYFAGTVDFDLSDDTASLTSAGSQDAFIAKYDINGDYVFAKRMGGPNQDECKAVYLDSLGYIYITGYFQNTADFDPSIDTVNLISSGSQCIFIAKYDPDGNYVFAKGMDGTDHSAGHSVTADELGNVYATGFFQGTVDFDPSPEIANLNSAGESDIFIVKLDADGNFVYVKQMVGALWDRGNSIVADGAGSVYLTGNFWGTTDFDPSSNTVNLVSASLGNSGAFLAKYDTDGNLIYAKGLEGSSGQTGTTIALDDFGNVYMGGYFYGTADFDLSSGTTDLTSAGDIDMFIAKYSEGNAGTGQFWNKPNAQYTFEWSSYFAGNNLGFKQLTIDADTLIDGNLFSRYHDYSVSYLGGTNSFDSAYFDTTSVLSDIAFYENDSVLYAYNVNSINYHVDTLYNFGASPGETWTISQLYLDGGGWSYNCDSLITVTVLDNGHITYQGEELYYLKVIYSGSDSEPMLEADTIFERFGSKRLSFLSISDYCHLNAPFADGGIIYNLTCYNDSEISFGQNCSFLNVYTSVDGLEQNQTAVYPNPADNSIRVQTSSKWIIISDLLGKQHLSVDVNNGQVDIDVSKLVNGIYLVQADNGKASKLIIQH